MKNCRRRARPDRKRERQASKERKPLAPAILALPADQRDVFLLNRIIGLTYEQISEHLGLPVETVESSIAAALLRLSKAMENGPA